MYLLYINGYMIFNNMRSLTFIGSKHGNKASFSSCNGYMKRVIRLKESKFYSFTLDLQLSKGEMWVELLDEAKHEIARLDVGKPTFSLELEAGKRYYIVYRFVSASGRYELKYE